MQKLGVKGIHVAERDTQRSKNPKPFDTFVNTWSVDGFISEGLQPAELGWGTHEKKMPEGRKFSSEARPQSSSNVRVLTLGCGAGYLRLVRSLPIS